MNFNQIKLAIISRIKQLGSLLVSLYRRVRDSVLRYFVPNTDDDDAKHVTTSNLEEHRKQILEQARRHVKPQVQTNSHVVRNSIIVAIVSLFAILIGLYVSVYRLQPTNNFYYQLSQILPIPVGEIAGQNINYDRVLFYFRAESRADSFELSENVVDSDADKQQRLERSFINARESVYIEALADAQGLNVSDEEVRDIISDLPLLESDSADLDVVLQEFRGWTRDDLFRETRIEALKSSKIIPSSVADLTQVTSVNNFNTLSSELVEAGATSATLSELEDIPDTVRQAARQLADNEASEVISVDANLYVLFKGPDNTSYTLVNSGLRKQLIELQANDAVSISCLSGLGDFSEAIATSVSYAGPTSCLF